MDVASWPTTLAAAFAFAFALALAVAIGVELSDGVALLRDSRSASLPSAAVSAAVAAACLANENGAEGWIGTTSQILIKLSLEPVMSCATLDV